MRSSLKSFIASMPTSPEKPEVQGEKVKILHSKPAGYVSPDLIRDGESGPGKSPLVLITAPGAMGKSAAAQSIAAETGMPYLDLAKVRVGSGSLTGELAKALGFKAMGQFVDDLKLGRASLVLDSSDEAQLTSGRDNYLAFLNDLAWLLLDAEPHNQVVMLGRKDSIDTTTLALMDLGLKPPVYQIAPLTHSQASGLIALSLDRKIDDAGTPYVVHRKHSGPFAELRDALFIDLASALDPSIGTDADYWTSTADFLGYPPVVAALAERLAVKNPGAALEELRSVQRSEKPIQRGVLLRSVLERILARESEKVRDRVGEALSILETNPERQALYGGDEQAARLLSVTGTVGVALEHPAILDEHERARYEELIESFILDHPFLASKKFANVVFSDYIRAWAISSAMSEFYAADRPEFFASLPKSGPFFAHFLHAMSVDEDEFGVVPEDVVNDVIQSFAMGSDLGYGIYVHRGDDAVLILQDGELRADDVPRAMRFRVSEASGVLILESPVARLTCVTDKDVLLRGVGGNLDLGPDVSIVADSVVIEAQVVTALADPRSLVRSLSLISARQVEHPGDLKVSALPANVLGVSWENPWHQWKPYIKDFSFGRSVSPVISSQVLLFLRRVLTSFNSSVKDDPSVSADKMDRVIVGANSVFAGTLQSLIGIGLVTRDGNLYRVNLDKLSYYGVSWNALHGNDPVESLRDLLIEVLTRPEMKHLLQE